MIKVALKKKKKKHIECCFSLYFKAWSNMEQCKRRERKKTSLAQALQGAVTAEP